MTTQMLYRNNTQRATWRIVMAVQILLVLLVPARTIGHPIPANAQGVGALHFFQDFDLPDSGLPYVAATHVAQPSPGVELRNGGPDDQGRYLRLAFADTIPSHNSIAFTRATAGVAEQVVADFDLRMTAGSGRADGLGFAFLNTTHFGVAGAAEPQAPYYAGEEPNFAGSIGIGFDIHQADGLRNEINNNHLSVHFDGVLIKEVAIVPLDLASGQWTHARIHLNAMAATLSVTLAQCNTTAVTVIDQLSIPGLTPYEGRLHFAARSGGESADHDLDNLSVQFLARDAEPIATAMRCSDNIHVYQDFDQADLGTPYVVGTHLPPPSPSPQLVEGGPTEQGQFLRLTYGDGQIAHNSVAFDRTAPGAYPQVVADFAFRVRAGTGRADGFGFALLNTALYGNHGTEPPPTIAEEPDFAGSLGIGFDIYQSTLDDTGNKEINDNHLSIHYDGQLVQTVDLRNAIDLAEGVWTHARIILRTAAPQPDLSVQLTQCGQPPQIVVDHLPLPTLVPYEARPYFAARVGGLTADQEIDDIRVHFLQEDESLLNFATGCYETVETADAIDIPVLRTGNLSETIAVNYATVAGLADPDQDFVPSSGTLTFAAGESRQLIHLPLLDDAAEESADEHFIVRLFGEQGHSFVGGPAATKIAIIDDELAQRQGYWHNLIPSQVVPIHAIMLPTGEVLYWDRHEKEWGWDGNPRLFDPRTNTIRPAAFIDYDIFCSGYAFLESGQLLVAGGHIADGFGEDKMSVYNPFTNEWERFDEMNAGRWYPTATTLANGDIVVMGGSFNLNGSLAVNSIPQVWDAINKRWRTLFGAKHDKQPEDPNAFPTRDYYPDHPDYYPFLYSAPNGQVFNAGPQQVARYLDTNGIGRWHDLAASGLEYRDYGSSVMYDDGKVLISGGNPRDPQLYIEPTVRPSTSTQVIDLADATPRWRDVGALNFPRRHLNLTLLPDGTVFANGGSSAPGFDNEEGMVLAAERWDPFTEEWQVMAAQKRYRGYHSTALLLPDGRVLSGGGGHPNPLRGAQHNWEIYSPPYLFQGPRPAITTAPPTVRYGEGFAIQTANATPIANVTWIRLSAVTHAFNQSQRINRLDFTQSGTTLTINAPSDANMAPPGHYMLFILDGKGVPSIAKIVQLQSNKTQGPPTATPTVIPTLTQVPTATPTVSPTATPMLTETPVPGLSIKQLYLPIVIRQE